jgi:pimeloyl-ACP methyl ester carboxylesterase
MITIGDRRLSIDCSGKTLDAGTVILIAGGGTTAKHWEKVQPEVSSFSRVCSYDRAGFGKSDKATASPQSVSEVVDDLHGLLKASGEKGPFILVAHSIAGIYTRSFVTRFPGEVKGLILIDSSHEEQVLRLDELDPNGPGPDNLTARNGFFVRPGQRLNWRTELPLIVLGRGMPFPRTNRMELAAWDGIWREFQNDLARRSTHGEFRLAEKSGHFIQLDQPELVIQAIRDVSGTR